MKRCFQILLIALILVSAQQLSAGMWIYAKAHLAKQLINNAWQQTLLDGDIHKPWSWADTWPVAKLEFPEHNITQVVLSSATGNALAFGPGHMIGSGLADAKATVIIAGHRDTHFAFLKDIQTGDKIWLQHQKGYTAYQVIGTEIVNSDQHQLSLTSDDATLMLVTCYPFGSLDTITNPNSPLRYVVHAKPIAQKQDQRGQSR